jgi:hypothetical protein
MRTCTGYNELLDPTSHEKDLAASCFRFYESFSWFSV